MYLRDARAIDYIQTRPDWDGKTIVIMGTSMGGQQSLVTAGLRPQVTAVIVNEPSGADSNGDLHGRKAGYPNWPSKDPKVMETALYFDTVNFASRIKAPVLAASGFIDTTAPPWNPTTTTGHLKSRASMSPAPRKCSVSSRTAASSSR
ncbi:Acetyl esterase Axe7A (fragment) [Candidatus Sulfopaludibacter sp. SbA3]